jgi:protein involved in polysaccharide export with SLBB domain
MRTGLLILLAAVLAGPAAAQEEGLVVIQAASGYALAPGDLVRIHVWGREEYSGQFQVDEEGKLHYPMPCARASSDCSPTRS